MAYLEAIGALIKSKMGRKRIYELAMPVGSVMSQKEFRVSKNMAEYSYAQKTIAQAVTLARNIPPRPMESIDQSWFHETPKLPQKPALFLSNPATNFASNSTNLAPEKANFAPILRETTETNTEIKKDLPPKIPPRTLKTDEVVDFDFDGTGSLRDPNGTPNSRRPVSSGQTAGRTNSEENFMNSKNNKSEDDELSEPLVNKPKNKKPKTQQELRGEAIRLSNAGHIVRPLGKIDNRKKELNWKLARDFGPEGKVTVPQLWRHLVRLWDDRFGAGILENMLSHDKSAMASKFGDLKQQFLNTCSHDASNRDLAEYFDWFLEPKRLNGILLNAKYQGPKGSVHFNQLNGSVFIKRFYDEVIGRRKLKNPMLESVESKADEVAGIVEQMFTEFKDTYDDPYKFTLKMVSNGYAMAAQYLHDEKEFSESECRQRIIQLMVDFIKKVPEPIKAVIYLKKGFITTKEHAPLLRKETCIWFDWEEKTKDLVDVAIQQSGVNIDERNESGGETTS